MLKLLSGLAFSVAFCGCQSEGKPAQEAPVPSAVVVVASAAPPPTSVALGADENVGAASDAGVALSDLDASAHVGVSWPFSELPLADDDALGYFASRKGGFSKDDRYLGYEISTCDPCPSEFTFVSPRAPAISISYFYNPSLDSDVQEKLRAKNDAMVDKKLLDLGVGSFVNSRALRGPFPYPDVSFVSKVERAPDDSVAIFLGAHLPGEEPVYPMRIQFSPHPMRAVVRKDKKQFAGLPPAEQAKQMQEMIDSFTMEDPVLTYVNLTKDGHEIGAVAIARGTFWYEAAAVGRMQTSAFVQKVKTETEKRHATKSDAGAH